jgi:hypothetical protein
MVSPIVALQRHKLVVVVVVPAAQALTQPAVLVVRVVLVLLPQQPVLRPFTVAVAVAVAEFLMHPVLAELAATVVVVPVEKPTLEHQVLQIPVVVVVELESLREMFLVELVDPV